MQAEAPTPTLNERTAPAAIEGLVTDQIYRLTGGTTPTTVMEWIHALGRRGINLATVDAPDDFTGCARDRTVYLPRGCSESEAMDIIAHELVHILVRELAHDIGRRIAKTFREVERG